LDKAQRALALYELGQDYMRAGLLGRAETLFAELVDQGEYRAEALEKLLDIYQQEKDWEKAIVAARRLEHLSGKRMNALVAQFYCELADGLRVKGEQKAALKLVKQALTANRQCVRASLLRATIEQAAGHYKAAIKALKQVELQDSRYLAEAVGPLVACYLAMGKAAEAERYLAGLLEKHDGITPLLALVDLLRQHRGEDAAAERIVSFLRKRPSVRGLDRLIELHLEDSEGVAHDNLLILRELTRGLLEDRATYQCGHCGFKSKVLRWQCPGCKNWGSALPIQGVVGE
jgi:lipopolysaccharide biosynthesis regulator YciM